ncbi:MAG: hypothetical protein WBA43_21695, partial [Elainellaceae cyanobacterium]
LDNAIAYFPKVEWGERVPALVLAWAIFLLGVQPSWLVRWSESTTAAMVSAVSPPTTQIITITTAMQSTEALMIPKN